MATTARMTIEGITEIRASFRKTGGPELVKQLGQVHKRIGELVIAKAGGADSGVGSGTGSTIRPSARTADVTLLVGGSHRAGLGKWRQWGKTQIFPPPGHRPYLIGAAIASEQDINEAYLDGINAVSAPLKIERR